VTGLKFAFDVDGVISEMPEFFSAITKALKKAGHQVFIVTDFDEHFREFREQELRDYHVEYDELVITSDKERFCSKNSIDYALDDDADYFPSSRQLRIYAIAPAQKT
jgi:hypothetical protein